MSACVHFRLGVSRLKFAPTRYAYQSCDVRCSICLVFVIYLFIYFFFFYQFCCFICISSFVTCVLVIALWLVFFISLVACFFGSLQDWSSSSLIRVLCNCISSLYCRADAFVVHNPIDEWTWCSIKRCCRLAYSRFVIIIFFYFFIDLYDFIFKFWLPSHARDDHIWMLSSLISWIFIRSRQVLAWGEPNAFMPFSLNDCVPCTCLQMTFYR